jgi:hypothetical protein
MVFFNYFPSLAIRDPKMLDEIYIAKNKYFDKVDTVKTLLYHLMGDSILLSESTEAWSNKRKALSHAFYKDKLIGILETVK